MPVSAMGSFVFKWPTAADEVYVTGTFDDWSKSVKLDKVGDGFQKSVELPEPFTKILYKFVVDGEWVADNNTLRETDENGNDNNVLLPGDLVRPPPATPTVFSSAAPAATTALLAAGVPLESAKAPVDDAPAPAATNGFTKTSVTSSDEEPEMANNIGVPGTFPETPAADLDKETTLINPFPAAPGGLNPVQLAPGEKIPEQFKTADINANVKLDPESYEKADTIIGGVTPGDLPPVSQNIIPESSLPIVGANDAHINSVGPTSTTAALAAAVPLEKSKAVDETTTAASVPAVVEESQKAAGFPPEASAVPKEVEEKAEVEDELLAKVPEVPATSEGTATGTQAATSGDGISTAGIVGGVTAGVVGLGAAALATAAATKDKAIEQGTPYLEKATAAAEGAATKLPVSVKQLLPTAVQDKIAAVSATTDGTASADVPAEVKESIQEAGTSPEAAANPVAVEDKKAFESELLQKAEAAEAADAAPAAAPVVAPASSSAADAVNGTTIATESPVDAAATAPAPGTASSPAVAAAAAAAASASSTTKATTSASSEKKKKNRVSNFFTRFIHKLEGDTKKK